MLVCETDRRRVIEKGTDRQTETESQRYRERGLGGGKKSLRINKSQVLRSCPAMTNVATIAVMSVQRLALVLRRVPKLALFYYS